MAQDLRSLRDYEDRTLAMLTESEQHLLDRHDLIENLMKSKTTSDEISERVRQNETNERQINLARQCYVSLAKRGSLLYFLLNDLFRLNLMYQFSLTWFQRTFLACILDRDMNHRMSMTNINLDQDPFQRLARQRRRSSLLTSFISSSPPSHSINEESSGEQTTVRVRSQPKSFVSTIDPVQRNLALNKMIERLTYTIYRLVSWSLFAEHQLLFSFLLTTTIEREETESDHDIPRLNFISKDEWTCFMSPLSNNINRDNLKIIHDKLPKLHQIACQLFDEQTDGFFQQIDPYQYLSQHELTKNLHCFQWILLIKFLRPEHLLPAISHYVNDRMGPSFVSSGFADIQEVYAHSSPQAPFILLLSPGKHRSPYENTICIYRNSDLSRNRSNKSSHAIC